MSDLPYREQNERGQIPLEQKFELHLFPTFLLHENQVTFLLFENLSFVMGS